MQASAAAETKGVALEGELAAWSRRREPVRAEAAQLESARAGAKESDGAIASACLDRRAISDESKLELSFLGAAKATSERERLNLHPSYAPFAVSRAVRGRRRRGARGGRGGARASSLRRGAVPSLADNKAE